MPVPVDPFPDFVPHTPAIADQVDARFKKLYDALNPAVVGLDNANVAANAAIAGSKLADGSIAKEKLASALADLLGVSGVGVVRRGSKIIPTTEPRTGTVTAYGTMPTPDQVDDIVLPTGGLILVWYHAHWNEAVDGAARAAIFLNTTQMKVGQTGVAAPAVQEASCSGGANITEPLSSCFFGLTSGGAGSAATGHAAPVTTGQALAVQGSTVDQAGSLGGGPCTIFADPGTYDVSVQYKASSGAVNALNRRLYVVAIGF